MKKLMTVAAMAALLAGGASAKEKESKEAIDAQVYDMTITLKVTECVKKSTQNVCGKAIGYRKQATQKITGKFYGPDNCVIAAPASYGTRPSEEELSESGYLFWGAKAAFHDAQMEWSFLQLVDAKASSAEGHFTLELYGHEKGHVVSDATATLSGAGYGSVTVKGCGDEGNILKTMNGSIVGFYSVTAMAVVTGCVYCGETNVCEPWSFSSCAEVDSARSAAYGTFTIKYNQKQASALSKGKGAQDTLFKGNKIALAEFDCIEN